MNPPAGTILLPAPHIHLRRTTFQIFLLGGLACLPVLVWKILVFGVPALTTQLLTILPLVLTDLGLARLGGRQNAYDAHGLYVGMVLAALLPPLTPWFLPVTAGVAAVLFKWLLGSYSGVPVHPSLFAWAIARISWPGAMTTAWTVSADGVQGLNNSLTRMAQSILPDGQGPFQILERIQGGGGSLATQLGDQLNAGLFSLMGIRVPAGYLAPLWGSVPVSQAEAAGLAILMVSILLFSLGIGAWRCSAGMFLAWVSLTWLVGGLPFGQGLARGDVLFFILHGSFLMAGLVVLPDVGTSPDSPVGHWIYGLISGFTGAALMVASLAPEAALVGVFAGNLLVAGVDQLLRRRRKV